MHFSETDKSFLVALHRCFNLTSRRFTALSHYFKGDWKRVFYKSSLTELVHAGLDKQAIEKFLATRADISPELEMRRLSLCKAKVLVTGDDDFPEALTCIYQPPVLLFSRGDIGLLTHEGIGIVGSRKITSYGKRVLQSFLPHLVSYKLPIVSGLALGTDVEAHRLTVQEGGKTICVLANGIDFIYPSAHKAFANKIIADGTGLILSEHLPGVELRPEYFPVRNRIIAGLSKALLVVEAAERSGTLITAQLALEQGKEVLSVPGDIFSPQSKGTNALINSGQASCVRSTEDIAHILQLDLVQRRIQADGYMPANEKESQILRIVKEGNEVHINEIIRLAAGDKGEIMSVCVLLEMKGVLTNVGSQKYVLG